MKWGPFTLAKWNTIIALRLSSGDDEDPGTHLMLTGFKRALRIKLPDFLKPCGKYGEWATEYGFSLSKEGNGYDFLQIFYGGQHEYGGPKNRKSWFLPWKQWKHVRASIYLPDGTHFADEGKRKWEEWYQLRDECPRCHFGFEDYDGEMIIASCRIEEREWHRGEKLFSWLRFFYPKKVRRSLDLDFSAEVGREKGSWKGGTTGTGIDMHPGETPEDAFKRWCLLDHYARGGVYYRVRYIGPCGPPPPKAAPEASPDNDPVQAR